MFSWRKKTLKKGEMEPDTRVSDGSPDVAPRSGEEPHEPLLAGGQGRGTSYEDLARQAKLPDPKPSDATRVRAGFLDKLARVAGRIPFAEDVTAAYFAAMDAKTPMKSKALLMSALAYFILPVDTIPDFIVGFGFADDATVLAAAIAAVASSIKPRHRAAARELLGLDEIARA